MASSPSDVLTPLQQEFLDQFFRQTSAFFLTGGTALSAFYLFHRRSEDLDLFTLEPEPLAYLTPVLEAVSRQIGAEWKAVQTAPAFRRFLLQRPHESVVVDCVYEVAVQLVTEKPRFGPIVVDSLEDICCNKLCTVLGRAEIKDYIDLYFLHLHGIDFKAYIDRARTKDAGMSKATLAYVLSQLSIDRLPPYMIKPLSLSELQQFFRRLAEELAAECFPEGSR